MPLQNLWFSVKLNTDIKGFKTSVLRPFLWAFLQHRKSFGLAGAPRCLKALDWATPQIPTPPEGGVGMGAVSAA
jgi:hypothetical protein